MRDTYVYIVVTTPDNRIVLQRTKIGSYERQKASGLLNKRGDIYTRWKATIIRRVMEENDALETAEKAIFTKLGASYKECGTMLRHIMSYSTPLQRIFEIYKFKLKSGSQLLLSGSAETLCLPYENVVGMIDEDSNNFTDDTISVMNVSRHFIA